MNIKFNHKAPSVHESLGISKERLNELIVFFDSVFSKAVEDKYTVSQIIEVFCTMKDEETVLLLMELGEQRVMSFVKTFASVVPFPTRGVVHN